MKMQDEVMNIIATLPEQSKIPVLQSIVGSLNATLVNMARTVVLRMSDNAPEFDFREVEVRDVIKAMQGPDENDEFLVNARITARVAQDLRDQLLALSNDDSRGSIASTIDFMTNPRTQRVDTEDATVKEMLEYLKLSEADLKVAELAQASLNARSAERLAGMRGGIEWVIEHVFTQTYEIEKFDKKGKLIGYEPVSEPSGALPVEILDRVHDKLRSSLKAARDDTIRGVLFKDRRYSFSDIPLIDGAIAEAQALDAHAE